MSINPYLIIMDVACRRVPMNLRAVRFLAWFFVSLVVSTRLVAAEGENMSSGKAVLFSPEPNYVYCSDSEDLIQLTDGVIYANTNPFWTQTGTVGWQQQKSVSITIDLGEDVPIGEIRWHMAAGRAGVRWPESVILYVSPDDDSERFYEVADLRTLADAPPSDKSGSGDAQVYHTFVVGNLQTHGRHVRLVFVANGDFIFLDELTITRGPEENLAIPYTSWASQDNIALQRPYTSNFEPNYLACKDDGDAQQITDGERYRGANALWLQTSTVGWWIITNEVEITIDLGSNQPIAGIAYHTGAGSGAVEWPKSIPILVRPDTDDDTFYYAGDLVKLSPQTPPDDGNGLATPRLHAFRTDGLQTYGRYVKLIIVPHGMSCAFVDEIEILRGENSFLTNSYREAVIDSDDIIYQVLVRSSIERRLHADLMSVRHLLTEFDHPDLLSEANTIESLLPSMEGVRVPANFEAVFPVNDLHTRIFSLLSAVWRAEGHSGIICSQICRWEALDPVHIPIPSESPEISIHLMNGEYRSSAFELSNAETNPVTVTLHIETSDANKAAAMSLFDVPFVDTETMTPVASALVPLINTNTSFEIVLHPGLTRQIWLTVNPTNWPAGSHYGTIRATYAQGSFEVPFVIQVYSPTLPASLSINFGGWDYLDLEERASLNSTNRADLLRILNQHYVDTPWATRQALPPGVYDEEGSMIEAPDTVAFDRWMDTWPNANRYLVYIAASNYFGGHAMGTPAFVRAVGEWISWWSQRFNQRKPPGAKLGLLLVDEPDRHTQDDVIIHHADAVHAAAPEVIIWNDPLWSNPLNAKPRLFEVSDVLSPNIDHWLKQGESYRQFFIEQCTGERELWLYACLGPAKLLDPYAYYRLLPWLAWKYGAKGVCVWGFTDTHGSTTWNEYVVSQGGYGTTYISRTNVISSKQMEALREGLQDRERFAMLLDYLNRLQALQIYHPDIEAAQLFVTQAVDRVVAPVQSLDDTWWHAARDRNLADQSSQDALQKLAALDQHLPRLIARTMTPNPLLGLVEPAEQFVRWGDTLSVKIQPALHYRVDSIEINGEPTAYSHTPDASFNHHWPDLASTALVQVTFSTLNTSNGVPHIWFVNYGLTNHNFETLSLMDSDEDGFSNRDEYIAGTDPSDPDSHFAIKGVQIDDGRAGLLFNTVPGRMYSVMRSSESPATLVHSGEPMRADDYFMLREVPLEHSSGLEYFRVFIQP